MASGDSSNVPKHLSFSRSNVPLIGALIDYVYTSIEYILHKSFIRGEQLRTVPSKKTLSGSFMAAVSFILGFICNIKLEVVTFDKEPLSMDLHFMIMSKDETLYINDIDVSKVMWCIEASDALLVFISSLLIWNTSNVVKRSPFSEYLYLPWLGASLRGIFLRQAPTTGALLYTMAVINGNVNPLFPTAFSLLFILEALLWLDIARVIQQRWEKRDHFNMKRDLREVETLWSNDDVQSVEVRNYVY